jgi:hypothetical protein
MIKEVKAFDSENNSEIRKIQDTFNNKVHVASATDFTGSIEEGKLILSQVDETPASINVALASLSANAEEQNTDTDYKKSLTPHIQLKDTTISNNNIAVSFSIANISEIEETINFPLDVLVFDKGGYNIKSITINDKSQPLNLHSSENEDLEFYVSLQKEIRPNEWFISPKSNLIKYEKLNCSLVQANIFPSKERFDLTNNQLNIETTIDIPISDWERAFDLYLSLSTPIEDFYYTNGVLAHHKVPYISNKLGRLIDTEESPSFLWVFDYNSPSGKYMIKHVAIDAATQKVVFEKEKEVVFLNEYSERKVYKQTAPYRLEKSITTDDEIIENLAKVISEEGSKVFIHSKNAMDFLSDSSEIINYYYDLLLNTSYTKATREKLFTVKVMETILSKSILYSSNMGLTDTVQKTVDRLIERSTSIGAISGFQVRLNFEHSEFGFDKSERELEVTIVPVMQFAGGQYPNDTYYPNTEPVTNGGTFNVSSKGRYTVGNIPRSGFYTIYAKDPVDNYTRKKTISMLRADTYEIAFDYKAKVDREYLEVFNDGTEEEEDTGGCIIVRGSSGGPLVGGEEII